MHCPQHFSRQQEVLLFGLATERDDRLVFDDDPGIRLLRGRNPRVELMLQGPDLSIRAQAQIEQTEWAALSAQHPRRPAPVLSASD